MSEAATKLVEALLQLPEPDRVAAAGLLWESLSEAGQAELLADPPDDPEFEAEIARRSNSLHDGTAELFDAADVFAEARERLRRKCEQ
jgi:hypothetical protein